MSEDLVRRVVFDTCVLRRASEAELCALDKRGFLLSVSVVAYAELGQRAVETAADAANEEERVRARRLLFRAFERSAPWLDTDMPIAFTGGDIAAELRAATDEERRDVEEANRAKSRRYLQRLQEDIALDTLFADIGLLHLEKNGDAADWVRLVERVGDVPDLPWAGMAHLEATEAILGILHRSNPTPEPARTDAYHRSFASEIARATLHDPSAPKPTPNDLHDLSLLMHLGMPAFLATDDVRFSGIVDASGSCQRPWIVTLEELLVGFDAGTLPVGLPWGESAERAACSYVRPNGRQRKELKAKARGMLDPTR